MSSLIANQSKNKYVFQFQLNSPSDTTRTGWGRWLWRLLIFSSIISSFPSTAFYKWSTYLSTAFCKCGTLSSTPVILLLTDSCISCSFPDVASSSFPIFVKIAACILSILCSLSRRDSVRSFWFSSLEVSQTLTRSFWFSALEGSCALAKSF